MMTNPIQGAGNGAVFPQAGQSRMGASQKASFQEIMSRYDPEKFSQADFKAMDEELRQAGIGRTHEAGLMLEDAGFSIDQFAKGGVGGMQNPGGPPPRSGGIDMQALNSFQEILSSYDLTNMSSKDQEKLMDDLTSSGLLQSGLILNIQV